MNRSVLDNQRRVAIVLDTTRGHVRKTLEGVNRYVLEHGPWSMFLHEHSLIDKEGGLLKKWADGVLTRLETPQSARVLHRRGVPFVNLGKDAYTPGIVCIGTDDERIAQLAATHFLERKFQHFAACAQAGPKWSAARSELFVQATKAAGFTCSTHATPRPSSAAEFERVQQDLVEWLVSLPKPVGVFATIDAVGRRVLDACHRAGLLVPEEVAVLGVDNDELLCHLASPPLSSIVPDLDRTGYIAAETLDRLMHGEEVKSEIIRLPPLGLVTRQSSDITAIEDRDIADAVRYIRHHACDGIKVSDILDHVRLSRRAFEHRFQQVMGRSPHAEIARVQLNRAVELLTNTDLSMTAVAHKTGFTHVEYLSAVCKKRLGKTPGEIRQAKNLGR